MVYAGNAFLNLLCFTKERNVTILHCYVYFEGYCHVPKYKPEITLIFRHRHVPKLVYKSAKEKKVMLDSIKRK